MKPEHDENIMKIDNACLTILRKCSLLSDVTAAPYFKAGFHNHSSNRIPFVPTHEPQKDPSYPCINIENLW